MPINNLEEIRFHEKILFVCVFAMLSEVSYAAAGYLAKEVSLIKVTSTTDSGANAFWVKSSGGTTNCSGFAMRYRTSNVVDDKAIDRAYALALSAYVAGKKVNVYTYKDTSDCNSAASIEFSEDQT